MYIELFALLVIKNYTKKLKEFRNISLGIVCTLYLGYMKTIQSIKKTVARSVGLYQKIDVN